MKTVRSWEVWKNPLVLRYLRSRMRPAAAGAWLLGTLLLCGFVVLGVYLGSVEYDALERWQAARSLIIPLLIIQGIILMLLGTGAVAGGITQEKVEGVLDYQRLTPMSRGAKIAGYFFGLPIREYAMFAITLPFMGFAVLRGNVPLGPMLTIYIVFFSSVWLYHMTGMAAGMVSRKWRRAARLSQALVVALYLILPQLSGLGLVFLDYLTVRPVIFAELTPILAEIGESLGNGFRNVDLSRGAPLFGSYVPIFLFSLLVQCLLMVTFVIMVRRKWKSDAAHSLSKPYALFFFGAFLLLVTGNAWGGLLTLFNPLALPVTFAFVSLFLAIILLGMVTPQLTTWRKGLRAAAKRGQRGLKLLQDEQMALPVALVVAAGAAILCGYLLQNAGATGAKLIQLPIALGVAVLSWQTFREWLGGKPLAFVALGLWLFPILLSIIIVAANNGIAERSLYIGVLSPLGTVIVAAGELLTDAGGEIPGRACWMGIILHAVSIIGASIPLLMERARLRKLELGVYQTPQQGQVAHGEAL